MYSWASCIDNDKTFSLVAQKRSSVSGQILKLKKDKGWRDSYVIIFDCQSSALHTVYTHYIIEFDFL